MPKVKTLDPALDNYDIMVLRIKKRLKELRVTQKWLADRLNISPSQLNYLFRTRHLKVVDLIRIATALGISKEEIGAWIV